MKLNWKKQLAWLDDNLLFILSVILILFIPLWPKIPLADLIPGYIVRLRLEDILVFFTFILYIIWAIRGKISWKMPTWKLIFANIAIGLMSILSGVFIINTIPLEILHFGKSFLHWARYIEYFFLAFLFFSTIKSKKSLKIVFTTMLVAVAAISIYGIGQKYLYWPLYSTMNREFSKGLRLIIEPGSHARIQSTFGGHYDFAAYLVLLLPFTLLIAWRAPKKWQKFIAWSVHLLGLWSLIVSAARTSILAYFAAVVILFTLNLWRQKIKLGKKIGFWFLHLSAYFLIIGAITLNFGQDMVERFAQVLNGIDPIRISYDNFRDWRRDLPYKLGWKDLQPPPNAVAVNLDVMGNNSVLTPTDTQPTPSENNSRPVDVYVDIPDIKYTVDASGEVVAYEATRTWSVNAEKYGLSMAIRLDTLWPNALRGFLRNPLLGSGYGMLGKGENMILFTEADSTDNNYLRTLGETGALGFITFYGTIIWTIVIAVKKSRSHSGIYSIASLGFAAASIGFLINASYIDVFAASKAAFTFWMLYGLFWANQKLIHHEK